MGYLEALRERVLVFDGGMGTGIQFRAPAPDAFQGHDGCNEWLSLTRPDLIADIHASFLAVGCDAIETNTFGAFSVVLDEYGLGAETRRLAEASARIARRVADEHAAPGRPRFVAGSIGPGTKLPSLGHIGFDDLAAAYEPLVDGLIEGGCDLLLVETCQDLLQLRAALDAVRRVSARRRVRLPVGVQITVETTGTMLLGTDTLAALAALLPLRPDTIGLNCATGPDAMRDHVRTLCRHSPAPVSVLPNAGLPRNDGGRMVYDLTPEHFADTLARFVEEFGVGVVGGCCGTEPRHLAALIARLGGRAAPRRAVEPLEALSSLYQAVPLAQSPRPLLIGERTNANGSKAFRERQAAGDVEGLVAMARAQQDEGAHVLDVCLAFVGRDEAADVAALMPRLNVEAQIPVMIDSTEPPAIEAALKRLGGRCIVNSINLEDGERRARDVLELCRRFGAAVVALCIDEQGMAREPARKLAVARRLTALAAQYGLGPQDMLIDPLTFTLGSGDEDSRRSALDTLEGLRLIKDGIPGARTLLGVSNVSFGLQPRVRRVLTSAFLRRALDAGLDAAILHAGKVLGADAVPAALWDACGRLIDDDRAGGDPLEVLLASDGVAPEAAPSEDLPVAQRLHRRIVSGRPQGLEADLDEALAAHAPLAIINDLLLPAMQEVGDLFGSGRLQLPFVLRSAETMKAAVRHLEPHMERSAAASRGRFVIATVKGDVHDIGKNLVDIILTNNGYTVDNLGIKVPVEQLIEAVRRDRPAAVGMSGLLVKSTLVMRDNLDAFNEAGIDLPVVLGGAALTRLYVERDLRRLYRGPVYYARDAFDGLRLVGAISRGEAPPAPVRGDAAPDDPSRDDEGTAAAIAIASPGPGSPLAPVARIPRPPFWGTRVTTGFDLAEVWTLLNRAALVKGRWGYTRAGLDAAGYAALQREEVEPALARLRRDALQDGWLQPAAIHGWFPCASDGDDLLVWATPDDAQPRWRFPFPRQAETPGRCLTDYVRPQPPDGGERDVLGVMVVTVGEAATAHCRDLLQADDYREYLLAHGFAVETAEALAEFQHRALRRELGIGGDDAAAPADLVKGRYRGRRFSFGYPACPDLEHQRLLQEMLDWERIGIRLSEECQLEPEQSTSALVFHHPGAEYFSI
jgi:5-methyltetrahydrofolate--homocysteine methyltransferase